MLKFFNNLYYQYIPVRFQQPLKRFILAIWNVWLPIYRIEQSGLTVIFIGNRACDPYIINLIYDEYIKPPRIGTVPIWSVDKRIMLWEESADLIIFRHRRFWPSTAVTLRMLAMPYYVRQSTDLPPADVDMLTVFHNSSTKRDLKKIHDAGFQYDVITHVHSEQLYFFYQQMYRPFIKDRHCFTDVILPWEDFQQSYKNMELLQVYSAGHLVAGSLTLQTDTCYTGHLHGILDADRGLLNSGVVAALYWFAMLEAHRRGCATVNMNCARPFLKDGVLVYKKKWGSRIVMDNRERELLLLPCGNRPQMHRYLEKNPFICEQDGRLVSLVFLGAHTVLNDKELTSYIKYCHYQGDSLSTCIVLLNDQWSARTEMIQALLRGLTQPNHLIDLSHRAIAELPECIRNCVGAK